MNVAWVVSLAGGRPGFDPDVCAGVCAALTNARIEPTRMKVRDEDGWEPFDRGRATRQVPGPIPHTMVIEAEGVRVLLSLDADPFLYAYLKPDAMERARLLVFGDDLAAACTPDLGWVYPDLEDVSSFDDRHRRLAALLTTGAGRSHDFNDRGPGAPGVRTYFGARALQHISAAALRALPASSRATDTSWGGILVDVVENIATAGHVELLDGFEATMAALAPTGFFARADITDVGVRFSAPAWWTPGSLGRGKRQPRRSAPAGAGDPLQRLRAAASGGAAISDFVARDLRAQGALLAGLRADRVDLSAGDFRQASFDRAVLVDVDLDDAQLEGASFRGAHFDQVGLRGALASRAAFAGAQIFSSFLDEAQLQNADFRGARLELPELGRAIAPGSSFEDARINDGYLGEGDFTGARFVRSTILKTGFTGANLSGADFTDARIDGCDFTGARLDGARWTGARITASKFDPGAGPR